MRYFKEIRIETKPSIFSVAVINKLYCKEIHFLYPQIVKVTF